MITNLAIQEIPTGDCRFLRLADNSYYNPDIPVENAIIEITVPGASCPVFFYTQKDFNTVFNSSTLELLPTTDYNCLIPLPEGVYRIKYSIQPNNILHQEFDLLRNCQQLQTYYKHLCQLFADRCTMSRSDFDKKLKELDWIKTLIDAAKYTVEECGDSNAGLALYDEAKYQLDKLC